MCTSCLFSSIVRQVRKAMSSYPIIKRREKALYIVRSDRPKVSLEALRILQRATRGLEIDLYVLYVVFGTYEPIATEDLDEWIKSYGIKHNVIVVRMDYVPKSFIEYVKLLEVLARIEATKLGLDVVISPLFRDELVFLSFIGLLKLENHVFGEIMPVKMSGSSPRISRPFFYVLGIDVEVLSYLSPRQVAVRSEDILYPFNEEDIAFLTHFVRVVTTSIELLYSYTKSVELIQSYVIGSLKRCRYCLAPSNTDPCPYCARFEELGLDLKTLA